MPRWAISLPARAARSLLQALVVFPALRLFARLEVRPANRAAGAGGPRGSGAAGALPGAGQAGAGRGPVLIAANHSSHLDVLLLLASLPRRLRRRVAVAMQPEYFEPWLRGTGSLVTRLHMGWHYRLVSLLLNTFPFPRSAAFKVALEHAGRLVDRGWSVLVFPEGELSRDGGMQPFRPGVGVLARDLRLAVLPARIRGAFEILPRGGRFPRRWRSEASVTWGEPLEIMAGEEPAAFARRLESAVRAL